MAFDHPSKPMEYPKETITSCSIKVENLDVPLQLGIDESYTLNVPADGSQCVITSKTVYGLYHALQTLTQIIEYNYDEELFHAVAAPYVISDSPQFSHRGILLDTGRHFEPVPVIKRFIDSMTFSKFNVFHWHVTDEESTPIESKAYPKFFEGAYTIKERYSTVIYQLYLV